MPEEDEKENTEQKIDETCKEVVLQEEVKKLKDALTDELNQAKRSLEGARQEVALWNTRINQISGSIAACSTLLEKSQKPKSLILQGRHDKKGKG